MYRVKMYIRSKVDVLLFQCDFDENDALNYKAVEIKDFGIDELSESLFKDLAGNKMKSTFINEKDEKEEIVFNEDVISNINKYIRYEKEGYFPVKIVLINI